MFRYPSPSLVISITALIVALGGAGYSATGGNFILGVSNSASSSTRLVATTANPALRIDNLSIAPTAAGIRIVTDAARPPLKVNSAVKVANLNADRLDDIDSSGFANRLTVPFDLGPLADSAPIAIPVADRPVLLAGVGSTEGDRGVAQVTLLKRPGSPGSFIEWAGIESPSGGAPSLTAGYSGITGDHIVYLDYGHLVDVEVVEGPNATGVDAAIRIHNGSTSQQTGMLTLIW